MKKHTKRALKIVDIAREPLEKIPYVTATSKGTGISYELLPGYSGEILGLPEELDALIIASDLQGIVDYKEEQVEEAPKLLGEELAEVLSLLFQICQTRKC